VYVCARVCIWVGKGGNVSVGGVGGRGRGRERAGGHINAPLGVDEAFAMTEVQKCRVGQNHTYKRSILGIFNFWHGNHPLCGHIRRVYIVLANLINDTR